MRNKDSHYGGTEIMDYGKPASDDDDDNMKKAHQSFLVIVNTFATFDTILKDHIESKDLVMRKCYHGTYKTISLVV